MNEGVERLSSLRSLPWIGPAGNCEIDRWITGWNTPIINVGEFLPRVATEEEVMVQQVVVLPIKSQIEDHAAAGGLVLPADLRLFVEGSIVTHQVTVGALHIAVAHTRDRP